MAANGTFQWKSVLKLHSVGLTGSTDGKVLTAVRRKRMNTAAAMEMEAPARVASVRSLQDENLVEHRLVRK